jgi:hypothetical protein
MMFRTECHDLVGIIHKILSSYLSLEARDPDRISVVFLITTGRCQDCTSD